ncbi:MAG TPA: glycosyltransferase [Kiritimatiellia bacterium]|nr:glycosyltransferase [Kiritimatiellia bacterium]HRZ11521.1 glycosyltransferase [Kiritimatiellia bacterium]HSA16928.1 glycosyltransferase [Kiritimatiellia bacterium]
MGRRLSIIIVAFNEAPNLPRLQPSIARLKRPAGCEIETVLVDGGSRDGTAQAARERGFDRVLDAPGASIPVCRNIGLKESSGEWIAFLDADCEPAADWAEQAAAQLEHEPRVILGWPVEPPAPMTWVQAAWHFHWQHKNRAIEQSARGEVVRREAFRLVTTRNMWLTRSAAEALGGFDERLATGEDTDFAFRAHRAGIPVLGVPALRVVHHGEPATLRAFFRQQLWHANRLSYSRVDGSGQRAGGNAPRFARLFAASLLLFALAVPAGWLGHWSGWLLALPLPVLVAGPAAWTCRKGGSFRHFPALCVLYFAYGLARAIDLAGLHREKKSWKSGSVSRA